MSVMKVPGLRLDPLFSLPFLLGVHSTLLSWGPPLLGTLLCPSSPLPVRRFLEGEGVSIGPLVDRVGRWVNFSFSSVAVIQYYPLMGSN